MKRWSAIFLLLCVGVIWLRHEPEVVPPPGPIAPEAPRQTTVERASIVIPGYALKPKADFTVKARVLSKKSYWFGRGTELSPVDLALGWGPMSDSAVLESFDISQRGRFYYWRSSNLPISKDTVVKHSANMHLIPANDGVRAEIKKAIRGELVLFHGYLVDVTAPDGWQWNSSTTRGDSGAGACEVVYVTDFRRVDPAEDN